MKNVKIRVALILAVIVAVSILVYTSTLPHEFSDRAIVQGTVVSVYNSSEGWIYNISLVKGTNGDLNKTTDASLPIKSNGLWYYELIAHCGKYSTGETVYIKIAIIDNPAGFPIRIQAYEIHGPGTEYMPSFYEPRGIGFYFVEGC